MPNFCLRDAPGFLKCVEDRIRKISKAPAVPWIMI